MCVFVRARVRVLLLSQLLDEDGDGRRVCSHLLDEGVVVLPLWLQTHLEHKQLNASTGLCVYSYDEG